jgi:hypothetical protein
MPDKQSDQLGINTIRTLSMDVGRKRARSLRPRLIMFDMFV